VVLFFSREAHSGREFFSLRFVGLSSWVSLVSFSPFRDPTKSLLFSPLFLLSPPISLFHNTNCLFFLPMEEAETISSFFATIAGVLKGSHLLSPFFSGEHERSASPFSFVSEREVKDLSDDLSTRRSSTPSLRITGSRRSSPSCLHQQTYAFQHLRPGVFTCPVSFSVTLRMTSLPLFSVRRDRAAEAAPLSSGNRKGMDLQTITGILLFQRERILSFFREGVGRCFFFATEMAVPFRPRARNLVLSS